LLLTADPTMRQVMSTPGIFGEKPEIEALSSVMGRKIQVFYYHGEKVRGNAFTLKPVQICIHLCPGPSIYVKGLFALTFLERCESIGCRYESSFFCLASCFA
jgi:hypothetical protein